MSEGDLAMLFRKSAVKARNLDELLGLCKGIIADNNVCESEAVFLLNWLETNKHVASEFPACVLYPRIIEMLADGVFTDEESKELLQMLQALTGESGQQGSANLSTEIAFNNPLPSITFAGQEFCLTGNFAYGRRKDVEERTAALGGKFVKSVVKRGCVVVVGCMGSEAWLHSTHGRKIKEAFAARDEGHPIVIVPEIHWHECAVACEEQSAYSQATTRTQAQHAIRDLLRHG